MGQAMAASDEFPSTSVSLLSELSRPVKNERAWLLFAQRYRPPLVAWCRRLGLQQADAEDVTQLILIKVARALHTFRHRPGHLFRGWLKAVALRTVYDFWRRRSRQPGQGSGDPLVEELLRQVPEVGDDTFTGLEQPIQADFLVAQEAIRLVQARIKDHTWQAFWITCIEDCPVDEAAHRLGLKAATVYQARHRVLEMLRQAAGQIRLRHGDAAQETKG